MTIMYVWLVRCESCREQVRVQTMTEAKQAFTQHLKKCSDVEKPRLIEADYIGS